MSLEGKYRYETDRSPVQGRARLEKARRILEDTGTTEDDWYFMTNRDYRWNTRRNRTELERRAVRLGQTNGAPHVVEEVMWFVPLTSSNVLEYNPVGGKND